MFRKSLLLATMAAGLLIPALTHGSTSTDSGTITITANVESYFEWDAGNVLSIDKDTGWTGGTGTSASHIGKPGDTIAATHQLVVNTNTNPTFHLAVVSNAGILTEAGTSTTLTTAYKLTTGTLGTITPSVAGFLPAALAGAGGAFDAGSTWALTQDAAGKSNFNLEVQAQIPAGITLPKAANYTCTVKITAVWS